MVLRENNKDSNKLLLDFLRQETSHRKPPGEFWNILENKYGDQLYSELLYLLTQMHFESREAREHWQNIQGHRDELERVNGRDVGLLVALADYFINVRPTVEAPIIVEFNLLLKKEETALRDELTGLYNRRFFNRVLHQELERSNRYDQPVSLLMIDVDHFKAFNDSYGHPAGDQALIEVARVIETTCRTIDHLTRYGGEEFSLILPRCDRDMALVVAERIRIFIENHDFLSRKDRGLTISIGVAAYPMDAASGLQLLEKADQALYNAKKSGRNRVSASTKEKRRHTRYPIELGMAFREIIDGREYLPGMTKNLSAGGMLGETRHAVEKGTVLELRLWPSDEDLDVNLRGQCLRVDQDPSDRNKYQLGVQFDLDSVVQETAIHALITNHSKKFH